MTCVVCCCDAAGELMEEAAEQGKTKKSKKKRKQKGVKLSLEDLGHWFAQTTPSMPSFSGGGGGGGGWDDFGGVSASSSGSGSSFSYVSALLHPSPRPTARPRASVCSAVWVSQGGSVGGSSRPRPSRAAGSSAGRRSGSAAGGAGRRPTSTNEVAHRMIMHVLRSQMRKDGSGPSSTKKK